jgi:predicted amidophosphoribosyltransferase
MAETSIDITGRTLCNPTAVAREARRLVGFERHYHCESCGCDRRSWTRLSACPDCGEPFVSAVIRRAAIAGA